MIGLVGVAVCFVFLTTLLLLATLFSHLSWLLKSGLIISSLGFGLLFFDGYVSMLGYSVKTEPPDLFRYLSSITREPMKDDGGAIFIWLIDLNGPPNPRGIELAYSKLLRDEIAEAKKRTQEGGIVYMGRSNHHKHREGGQNTVPYVVTGEEDLEFKLAPDTLPPKSDK